jgi:uncharacterized protein (DUF1800 family)
MDDRATVAHVLRRAAFGPTAEEVDVAERVGLAATVDALVAPATPDPGAAATPPPRLGPDPHLALGGKPSREDRQKANQARRDQVTTTIAWWLDRMVAADHQLAEKLVFFWHGHWATSVQKVRSARLMLTQQQTFRDLGHGDFGALAAAMVRDPALVVWLDGQKSTRRAPNENLARELMELFTLGIGHYAETDVKEGARALTGWTVDRVTGATRLVERRHDDGAKTILGQTAPFDAASFAALLVRQPANAPFLAGRFWFRFASGEPMPPEATARLVTAYGGNRDVTALLRALFTDPAFPATKGQLVKQPVEWTVGAMRQLGVRPSALTDQQRKQVLAGLNGLDQVPLRPPSVGGWPADAAWLTTSALQVRMRVAELLAARAATPVVDRLAAAPTAGRVDALARLLVVDAWTERTRTVLAAAAEQPRRLLSLGLISPEYTVL